jgi:hypothetical protein
MAQRVNATIIVFIVVILVSLALSGVGFYLFQQEQLKRLYLEQRLSELTLKQKETETELKVSEKLTYELQYKLEQSKSQIDTLNNELQKEKAARTQDLARLEQTRQELEQQKSSRWDLENRVNLAQQDTRKAVDRLKELDSKKRELESKVKELEFKVKDLEARSQRVELGKIVVSPETIESISPPQEKTEIIQPQPMEAKKEMSVKAAQGLVGSILIINRDYNFAVINLGSKDGVNLADVFSVYHNNNYLGDIKVEKVHDSMSAAGFVSAGIKDRVSEGDKVVQKSK